MPSDGGTPANGGMPAATGGSTSGGDMGGMSMAGGQPQMAGQSTGGMSTAGGQAAGGGGPLLAKAEIVLDPTYATVSTTTAITRPMKTSYPKLLRVVSAAVPIGLICRWSIAEICVPLQPNLGPDVCGFGDSDCDGEVDEDCEGCQQDGDVCVDGCPEGSACNQTCTECVGLGDGTCTVVDGIWDECGPVEECDPNCRGCAELMNLAKVQTCATVVMMIVTVRLMKILFRKTSRVVRGFASARAPPVRER